MDVANLDCSRIMEMREHLYLGRGYYIIRNYLSPAQAEYMRTFWNIHHNRKRVRFSRNRHIYATCPNATVGTKDVFRHWNFFWNKPLDPFTYSTAWKLQTLRNRIEGAPSNMEYLPHTQTYNDRLNYCISAYLLAFTRQGGPVEPHADWGLDHSRVQMSLMLSSYGPDYQDGGVVLYDKFRGGVPRSISASENLQAGDLLIFRFAHKHGINAVVSREDDHGFCRMLMATAQIPVLSRSGRALHWAKERIQKIMGRNYHRGADEIAPSEEVYYDEDTLELMQIAIRQGLDPADVFYHRGLWGRFKEFQDWQMKAVVKYGVQPHHHFLDIGCGMQRLGMKLIEYLDNDRYCGTDPLQPYIDLGRIYLDQVVQTKKTYHLLCDHHFDFEKFQRSFDFSMAASVFTHMSFKQIELCFSQLQPVMKRNGQLIFTISLDTVRGAQDREVPFVYGYNTPMIRSFHKDMKFYEHLGKKYGLRIELLGREGHPSQHVCRVTF